MDLETFREYCLKKPHATEGTPFGEDVLVFKVGGKMFALTSLDEIPATVNLKCDPDRALELSQRAVSLAPVKGTYQNTLGVCLYRLERYKEAITAFEKSLTAGKGQLDGYDLFFMAMCWARLDEPERARECLDRAQKWQGTTKLTAHEIEELKLIGHEAETVLHEQRG